VSGRDAGRIISLAAGLLQSAYARNVLTLNEQLPAALSDPCRRPSGRRGEEKSVSDALSAEPHVLDLQLLAHSL
jgi:hypothetical protein